MRDAIVNAVMKTENAEYNEATLAALTAGRVSYIMAMERDACKTVLEDLLETAEDGKWIAVSQGVQVGVYDDETEAENATSTKPFPHVLAWGRKQGTGWLMRIRHTEKRRCVCGKCHGDKYRTLVTEYECDIYTLNNPDTPPSER